MLWQRTAAASQRVWKTAVPVSSRGLWVIQDTGKKTVERLRAMPWRTMARRYKVSLLVLGGGLLAAVLLVIIIQVPQWQATSWRGQPGVELKDLPKLENDARTTLIQGLGGAVLLIGLYLTLRNLQLTQDRQISEHYTRAVEHLGSSKLEVRLGAIYALERIARDSERDHWPIMEILTAYVRERAPWKAEVQSQQTQLATDIQAILTVLGRRPQIRRRGEQSYLDLSGTDLRLANLSDTHLGTVDLTNAHLEKAHLDSAHLERAILMHAHLEGATLMDTHLEEAIFLDTHLEGATLIHARLEGAVLTDAHLEGANLMYAHLERAVLRATCLQGAINLRVEQLSTVKTLYEAKLNSPLLREIEQQYPQLRKDPVESTRTR